MSTRPENEWIEIRDWLALRRLRGDALSEKEAALLEAMNAQLRAALAPLVFSDEVESAIAFARTLRAGRVRSE